LRSENNRFSIFLLGTLLFGIYCFVFGQSGILERMRLEKEKESLVREIAYLERDNGRLESLYNEYVKGSLTVAECETAGFLVHGSRFLFFKDKPHNIKDRSSVSSSADADTAFPIDYLRIVWILISITIISVYFIVQRTLRRKNLLKTDRTDE
jgi:hypothetical protein